MYDGTGLYIVWTNPVENKPLRRLLLPQTVRLIHVRVLSRNHHVAIYDTIHTLLNSNRLACVCMVFESIQSLHPHVSGLPPSMSMCDNSPPCSCACVV